MNLKDCPDTKIVLNTHTALEAYDTYNRHDIAGFCKDDTQLYLPIEAKAQITHSCFENSSSVIINNLSKK